MAWGSCLQKRWLHVDKDLPIFCVVKILHMIQLLFSAQLMVLFASTTVCISPTPFSVQDSLGYHKYEILN
jgi:hypothetical protein